MAGVALEKKWGKGTHWNWRYIVSYLSEATPEDYVTIKQTHGNYSESKQLLSSQKWSNRVIEIGELVKGDRILEIGAAEGLQSLYLAQFKSYVCGIEISNLRYQKALELSKNMEKLGYRISNCDFIHGDILRQADLLKDFDTILIVRVLYHFRQMDDIYLLVDSILSKVNSVIIVGDRIKSEMFYAFNVSMKWNPVPFFNFASHEGMEFLLERADFSVSKGETTFGDPYVVGVKKKS